MQEVLANIFRAYQAFILDDMARSYGLDRAVLFRKYDTPNFYQPFVVEDPREVVVLAGEEKKQYKAAGRAKGSTKE